MRRFNPKWKKDKNGCHVWQGSKTNDGYGRFFMNGKVVSAHRWMFEQTHGYLPEVVMHTCDNPPCVNVEHLRAGTLAENMQDMVSKGRWRNASGSGETKPNGTFTQADAEEVRRRYATEKTTYRALAKEYGLHHSTIERIVTGKSWK